MKGLSVAGQGNWTDEINIGNSFLAVCDASSNIELTAPFPRKTE